MAIPDALDGPFLKCRSFVLEIDYGDVAKWYLYMLQQDGERASRYRAVSDYQHLAIELHHR
jgi:hypothetical protein